MNRLINSGALHGTSPIQKLKDTENQDIDEFPGTPDELRRLSLVDCNRVLQRLNMDTTGTIMQKRARLFLAAGIVNEKRDILSV